YVGLDRVRGVVVEDVGDENSPAARAGLRLGDVILGIDGKPAEYVGQLQQAVAFRKPGETVSVEVARKGGARTNVRVTLQDVEKGSTLAKAERSESEDSDERPSTSRGASSIGRLGLTVENLSRDAASELGLPSTVHGVAISGVDPNGPCAERVNNTQTA